MKKISAMDVAVRFLENHGGRANVSEVIDAVLKEKHYSGETPRNTVSAMLNNSPRIKKKNRFCELVNG